MVFPLVFHSLYNLSVSGVTTKREFSACMFVRVRTHFYALSSAPRLHVTEHLRNESFKPMCPSKFGRYFTLFSRTHVPQFTIRRRKVLRCRPPGDISETVTADRSSDRELLSRAYRELGMRLLYRRNIAPPIQYSEER